MALSGSDVLELGAWIRDLTYKEIHAAAFGAIHATGIVAALILSVNGVPWAFETGIALVAVVFVLLGWLPKGDAANLPLVSHILERMPTWLKGQIRAEPHYYGGAGIAMLVLELAIYVGAVTGLIPGF